MPSDFSCPVASDFSWPGLAVAGRCGAGAVSVVCVGGGGGGSGSGSCGCRGPVLRAGRSGPFGWTTGGGLCGTDERGVAIDFPGLLSARCTGACTAPGCVRAIPGSKTSTVRRRKEPNHRAGATQRMVHACQVRTNRVKQHCCARPNPSLSGKPQLQLSEVPFALPLAVASTGMRCSNITDRTAPLREAPCRPAQEPGKPTQSDAPAAGPGIRLELSRSIEHTEVGPTAEFSTIRRKFGCTVRQRDHA